MTAAPAARSAPAAADAPFLNAQGMTGGYGAADILHGCTLTVEKGFSDSCPSYTAQSRKCPTCPTVRFDLLALRWEPGEADGVMTLAPSTVIGRTMLDPWGSLATAEEKAYATHVALVKQRHRSARVPIIERRGDATPSAWRDAYAYFERLNRSVPFTAAELDAFAAFVETA